MKYKAASTAIIIAKRSDFIKHPAIFFNMITAIMNAIIKKM